MPSPRPPLLTATALAATSLLAAAALVPTGAGAQTFYGPTPYLRASDSPFSGLAFSYFSLDRFEGPTRTPGVTFSAGTRLAPGPLNDSVDEDDGVVDGSGVGGGSWYLGGTSVLTMTFDAAVLGALPTHAGIVWTDVGFVQSGTLGVGQVRFRAYGPGLTLLGSGVGPVTLGDGVAGGGTAEDRFFGVAFAGGIERIEIVAENSADWEVDHLQYGRLAPATVPEPATGVLLAGPIALGVTLARRRRRA